MTLFDKQIAPILLYGSSIWSIPSSHNLIYLDNLPEVGNTRTTTSKTFMKRVAVTFHSPVLEELARQAQTALDAY